MKQSIITILIILLIKNTIYAQPGTLDSSFAEYGKIIGEPGALGTPVLQADDKILLSGGSGTGQFLIRYLPDGKIDTYFGEAGIVNIKNFYIGVGLAIDTKNAIVTVGSAYGKIYFSHFMLNDGKLDSTFGISGVITTELGFGSDTAVGISAMQLQADDKIVVTGSIAFGYELKETLPVVARFMPDGSPDESFGIGGKVIINGQSALQAKALDITKDGKIVIGGWAIISNNTFFTARLNTNGSLDETYGTGGIVVTVFKNESGVIIGKWYINSIVVQNDGKIVAGGYRSIYPSKFSAYMKVVRYQINGDLDNGFGDSGIATIEYPLKNTALYSILLQKDGNIIVAGIGIPDKGPSEDNIAIARLTEKGVIDSTFGTNGLSITDFGGNDQISAAALQTDGKIVVAGNSTYLLLLARFNGDPTKTRPTIAQIKRWIRNHILHFEDANTNAAYYVIEKSTASNTGFVPVTRITANAATTNYSYTLPETATQSTYRIKAVNKDNSITYSSPISSSDPAKAGVASFKIYPNPAKDRITVETSGAVQLRLQNSNGRVLLTQMVNGKGSIDISKLPNGIYYVVNTVNGESLKVVKE